MSDIERIVVLAGGLSPEREVSLRSGDRVRDDRVDARLGQGVADPLPGVQRHFPFGGQAAGQYDDALKIAHGFEILP